MKGLYKVTISDDGRSVSVELVKGGVKNILTGNIVESEKEYCLTLSGMGEENSKSYRLYIRKSSPNMRDDIERGVVDFFDFPKNRSFLGKIFWAVFMVFLISFGVKSTKFFLDKIGDRAQVGSVESRELKVK